MGSGRAPAGAVADLRAAPPLRVVGLHKRFGDRVVLDVVDLTVGHGEVVALLGPNGAGKTTLLRAVVDLVRPDAGEVLVAGVPVAGRPSAVARVGWALGDEHAWYLRLSGRHNLQLFGRMRGMRPASAAAGADALLEELGLSSAADRTVATYSTGMRARLALGRARLGDPAVIILDEVGRGLDAAAEEQFVAWLRGRERPAVLTVTHAPEQVAGVADRIVLLQGGRVAEELPGNAPGLAQRVRGLAR